MDSVSSGSFAFFRTTARAAARFVLPSDCLACRVRPVDRFLEGGVCETCWSSLPPRADARCAVCDEALPRFEEPKTHPGAFEELPRCGRCLLDPPEFAALAAAFPYSGSAREILLAFKFQGADYLAPRLAASMTERLALPDPLPEEMVCVPATPRARRARGYHAAEILASALASRLRIRFARRRLAKRRETEVQSRMPLGRRSANVRGAFLVSGRPAERILLIDDVATSGATARECARRLTRAGARAVTVWCFARASRSDAPREIA